MSIVPLQQVTLVGALADKTALLDGLQGLGCVHLEPLRQDGDGAAGGPGPGARQALHFLQTAPQRRHQVHHPEGFDARTVEQRALAIAERLRELADQRQLLLRRIRDLRVWGDFRLPDPEQRLGLRLWFYAVPHYRLRHIPAHAPPWQVVHRDNRLAYVAVLAQQEPQGFPVPRTHTGSLPLRELRRRLEANEVEEDELRAERIALTRWLDQFAATLASLEDEAERSAAARLTRDDPALFVLSGWAPCAQVDALCALASAHRALLRVTQPAADTQPPTLLSNRGLMISGQDLLGIYLTPGYRSWDPSPVLLAGFALFFGLILADAGYALVLAFIALVWRRRLGRGAGLLLLLAASAALAGLVSGSLFGLGPPDGSALARLRLLDTSDTVAMMEFSAAIGVLHLGLANAIVAGRRRGTARLAPSGWVLVLLGGSALYAGLTRQLPALQSLGQAGLALGITAVVVFSGAGRRPLARASDGLLALTRLSAAFGDVLSYLRLFALGYAGTSLAVAFNGLAASVAGQSHSLGLPAAAAILLLGHGLNFVLGVSGGFIHGLRLNFIEFFNWSMDSEGRPFRAFHKRHPATSEPT